MNHGVQDPTIIIKHQELHAELTKATEVGGHVGQAGTLIPNNLTNERRFL